MAGLASGCKDRNRNESGRLRFRQSERGVGHLPPPSMLDGLSCVLSFHRIDLVCSFILRSSSEKQSEVIIKP